MQISRQDLQGIINAGPSQQGIPTELAAQNSQAINAAAASNQKAQQEIGLNAAKGTANPGVESGVTQAERSSAATAVDTNLNNTEANITQKNYDIGRQNYWRPKGKKKLQLRLRILRTKRQARHGRKPSYGYASEPERAGQHGQ